MTTRESIKAYAQLVRLPNVFTALADVWMGWLVVQVMTGHKVPIVTLLLLMVSSTCYYWAGMIFNDYYDLEEDRRDRPFRPLPSQRINIYVARGIGIALLLIGFLLLMLATDWVFGCGIGVSLGGAIILYDCGLKKTLFGPLGMGLCRFLNVILGFSGSFAVGPGTDPKELLSVAAVVGSYIVGVTCFAKHETRQSSRPLLILGAIVFFLAALQFAHYISALRALSVNATILWAAVAGLLLAFPMTWAIIDPRPSRVQQAVKAGIIGVIFLDTFLATSIAGPQGFWIILLVPPALFLGRWIYST